MHSQCARRGSVTARGPTLTAPRSTNSRAACGPQVLEDGKNILYHNNGAGSVTDVSDEAAVLKTYGTYGLGVVTADFHNDSWPDIYETPVNVPSPLLR